MLQVKNLNKSFGSKQVLFDINFKADNGKILGLKMAQEKLLFFIAF